MYVALTGTPGTGKTGAAKQLSARGLSVITVEGLARTHGAIETVNGDLEVDTEALSKVLVEPSGTVIIEGHLSHHLPNSVCIILRCHPEEIRRRLSSRNYSPEKVMANLEAEAVDIILGEALERCGAVFEIDTTSMGVGAVADAIESIINGNAHGYLPGKIDWSGAVMDWY